MTAETSRDPDAVDFGRLQTLLLSVEGVDAFLQELAEMTSEVVEPEVSCGITTEHEGQPLTVASSDARARAFDESQYGYHEGPCLHAMYKGEVVDLRDVDAESRWPRYIEDARKLGLRSSLSLPLVVQGQSIGAMNLYSLSEKDAFGDRDRERATAFAAQASTAVMLALRQARQSAVQDQLERALTSRSVIDQALGILMAQQRCDAEEAFRLLRAHSQNHNRKLRDVAADLVARTTTKPA